MLFPNRRSAPGWLLARLRIAKKSRRSYDSWTRRDLNVITGADPRFPDLLRVSRRLNDGPALATPDVLVAVDGVLPTAEGDERPDLRVGPPRRGPRQEVRPRPRPSSDQFPDPCRILPDYCSPGRRHAIIAASRRCIPRPAPQPADPLRWPYLPRRLFDLPPPSLLGHHRRSRYCRSVNISPPGPHARGRSSVASRYRA